MTYEYHEIPLQTVLAGANVIFDGESHCGGIVHRDDTGIFTIKGGTGKWRVTFFGNLGGATADVPATLAIAIGGEPALTTQMIVTPSVANALNNVYASVVLSAPCCVQIAISNNSAAPETVQNANVIFERL